MRREFAFKTRETREDRRVPRREQKETKWNPRTDRSVPRLLTVETVSREDEISVCMELPSITLSVRDAQTLLDHLDAPPSPNARLRAAAQKYLRGLRARSEQ